MVITEDFDHLVNQGTSHPASEPSRPRLLAGEPSRPRHLAGEPSRPRVLAGAFTAMVSSTGNLRLQARVAALRGVALSPAPSHAHTRSQLAGAIQCVTLERRYCTRYHFHVDIMRMTCDDGRNRMIHDGKYSLSSPRERVLGTCVRPGAAEPD